MTAPVTDMWPWLAFAGLGAFHGLNPGMGWLFAVALGLHRGDRRIVWLAPIPIALGHALVGTVDTVTRQLEGLLKRLPVSWIFAWMYNGLMAHDRLMKTIELFATKVLPRVANPG